MIYPSYGTLLHPQHSEEAIGVVEVLKRLRFQDIPDRYGLLYADGVQHNVKYWEHKDSVDFDVIDNKEFIHIYQEFEEKLLDFLINLQVGSRVIPDQRHLKGYYYPFTYTDDMENLYAGKEYIIRKIEPASDYGIEIKDKPAYNGDDRVFILDGISDYMWHSSMFLMEPMTPIKRVELSSINIDLGF